MKDSTGDSARTNGASHDIGAIMAEDIRQGFAGESSEAHLSKKDSKKNYIKAAFEKLSDIAESSIDKIEVNSPDERHLLIILFVTIMFSALCHFVQILFFLFMGSLPLVLINMGSILAYLVCIAFLYKNKTVATGILFSCEISIVAMAMSYLIGTGTFHFSYFFILLLIQMIIPYAGWKVRIPAIIGIIACLFISFAMGEADLARIDISPIETAYSTFNLLVGASSIIAIIAINNAVNKMIWRIHKMKLEKYIGEAHMDTLTRLHNRRYAKIIFEEINSSKDEYGEWCVAMLDIDDFKLLNDKYGHDFGDIVLQQLAENIKQSVRKTDYVFRWGGEEFLILLKNFDIKDSYFILDRMRIAIQDNKIYGLGHNVNLTVTIGLSKCLGSDIEKSIKKSDQNLYKGKASGKNIVVM